MSDGPHKTLQMKPRWRKLSMRADAAAFTVDEVTEALIPALQGDWVAEISGPFLKAIEQALIPGDQAALFSDQASEDVRALRPDCDSPMEAILVDAALDALADGFRGQAALDQAVEAALAERALRGFRQVEEHYLREAPTRRAVGVRARLEKSLSAGQIRNLARSLLGGPAVGKAAAPKHSGLDDGVAL